MGDTGTCCSLLGVNAADLKADRTLLGQLLETFVFQDIKRLASWYEQPLRLSHYRDRDGYEVDIVVEKNSRAVAGIEIKAAATVNAKDF
jgi:predicted AAA+ superfamily ATPase